MTVRLSGVVFDGGRSEVKRKVEGENVDLDSQDITIGSDRTGLIWYLKRKIEGGHVIYNSICGHRIYRLNAYSPEELKLKLAVIYEGTAG